MARRPLSDPETPSQRKARTEREYRFHEARHLMSFGVHPERLLAQLGTTVGALESQARNHGAHDIAAYIASADRDICGCGSTMSRGSIRCRACRDEWVRP